jgi:hypothetical protein
VPSPSSVLSIFLAAIVGFYLMSAAYQPVESASLHLSRELGEEHNETLGTCSSTGDCTFYTAYTPIKSGSWVVYANGTPHTSWVNATVAVTLSSGLVNITATGANPSTANAEIEITYARDPGIEGISTISSLPAVGVFLFVLIFLMGMFMLMTGGMRR